MANPRNPHAVNHMIVGDIGHEEILLASSDDGDVIAFTTNSVHQAIQDNVAGNTDIGCRLNAFFIENVGHSAWGLAIHKAARLIAVSANTHEITVFAFALGDGLVHESGSEDEDYSLSSPIDGLGGDTHWLCVEGSIDLHERSNRNIKVRLIGHETNIPNITFCNSDADPHGQYLLSTDIDGQTFVWDVWQKKRIGDLSKIGDAAGRPSSGGWGVACLDPKALRRADVPTNSGCDASRSSDSFQGSFRDISASVDDVPDSSHFHPAMVEFRSVPSPIRYARPNVWDQEYRTYLAGGDYESNNIWDTFDEIFNDGDDEDSDEHDEQDQEAWEQQAGLDETVGEDPSLSGQEEPYVDGWEELLETLIEGNIRRRRPNVTSPISDTAPMQRLESENNLSQHASGNTFHRAQNLQTQQPGTPSSPLGSNSSPSGRKKDLPFYFLCTNRHSINLSNLRAPPASYVVCSNILRQVTPPRLAYLNNFERLNMIEQIPELGLVIIASQAGRVAILTTTKSKDPPNTAMSVGLKIERILPFKSQEDAGMRPEMPLMGIAVGPVQGHGIEVEASGDERPVERELDAPKLGDGRYRLLMIYCDHTVLSYEIGRSKTRTGYEVNDRVLLI